MKEIDIFIKPEKLEKLKIIIVDQFHCGGMTVVNAMGCGNQKGFNDEMIGMKSSVNLLPKMKVEVIAEDEQVTPLIDAICEQLSTGLVGDGKIVVKPIEDVIRVRTGEHGNSAV